MLVLHEDFLQNVHKNVIHSKIIERISGIDTLSRDSSVRIKYAVAIILFIENSSRINNGFNNLQQPLKCVLFFLNGTFCCTLFFRITAWVDHGGWAS